MPLFKHEIPSMFGQSGKYLTNNGVIDSWSTIPVPTPGGSDTQVQYNSGGSFAGDASFTFDRSTSTVSVANEIVNYDLSLPFIANQSILFMNGSSVSQDPGVLFYDINNEIFYATLTAYIASFGTVTGTYSPSGSSSFISTGAEMIVSTDNLTGGSGGGSKISCGARVTGVSDNTGAPAAGGDAGISFISCGGPSDVYQGCTVGVQGNGGTVFISSGGMDIANTAAGIGGSVQVCGVVDGSGGVGAIATGTFNNFASTTNFYGGVNFLSSVFATAFEIGTLTVDSRISLIDTVTVSNVPTPLLISRNSATAGEYSGQIVFGGADTTINACLFGQVYGDYNAGYMYFSYPNQFGAVGGSANPVLAFVPASTGAVAGHIYNHIGVNCFPTDADYDLQFNPTGYGIGRQRNAAGSGADLGDWIIFAGAPSVSQTNVSGGNLKLRSGLTTGSKATEVISEVYAASGSGSSDNTPVEGFAVSSTGLRTRYKVAKFNNVTAVGYGVPAIYGNTRLTAKTSAQTVSTTAVGAADGSFEISANVLVTTSTLHSFTVTCTYTDEGNTSRTLTLTFSNVGGTLLTAIANAGGAVPYEGIPLHIRAKASTNIVIASTGTFTTVTYNIESMVKQTS